MLTSAIQPWPKPDRFALVRGIEIKPRTIDRLPKPSNRINSRTLPNAAGVARLFLWLKVIRALFPSAHFG